MAPEACEAEELQEVRNVSILHVEAGIELPVVDVCLRADAESSSVSRAVLHSEDQDGVAMGRLMVNRYIADDTVSAGGDETQT